MTARLDPDKLVLYGSLHRSANHNINAGGSFGKHAADEPDARRVRIELMRLLEPASAPVNDILGNSGAETMGHTIQ